MGGSSGSSSGSTTYTMRYADYIEARHKVFLTDTYNYRRAAIANNPYEDYVDIPVESGFFGAGYVISSFPALFDMFGKFVGGLDVEALWEQIVGESVDSPTVTAAVSAESALLDDELDSTLLPKYMAGMRDLNAVVSSSFVIGKAQILDTKVKQLAKLDSDLRTKMLTLGHDRFKIHLDWNSNVVNMYRELFNYYYTIKSNITELNYDFATKNIIWPMTVLDYERANLGALQGAQKSTSASSSGGVSKLGSTVGGAASGAAIGAQVGGGYGAIVGAVVGGVAGYLSS